ncbi:hypothetical protein FQN54_002648 [Arachnomyces sp. PD_36]|nr:hypothetical protein FQN54_002648 [Arachnomyces sp. PD_36]
MTGFYISTLYLLSAVGGGIGALAQSTDPLPSWPLQTFKTTSYQPPYLNVTKAGQTEPGFLIFAPFDFSRNATAPLIYSDDGQLVFYGPREGGYSLRAQELNGERVLTYWTGAAVDGFGFGSVVILDDSYEQIGEVALPESDDNIFETIFPTDFPSYVDNHEDTITEEGTMLVTAVNVTQADLRAVGGPKDGWVQDGLVYEIDVETNDVLFRWSTLEHIQDIPLSDVEAPLEGTGFNSSAPWGYPHLNSVAKYGDNYLISSRFMCSLFFVDKDGELIWKLHGQNGGDFELGPGTNFCYQHIARFESQTDDMITINIHNNENTHFTSKTIQTTGLALDLDLKTKKVTLNRELWDPVEPVYAESQGSYQNLDNRHVLMAHGAVPKIAEFDGDGACVMRAWFGYEGTTSAYRVFRSPWVGKPNTKPDVVACPEEGGTAVYTSWNGATHIESWDVFAGSDAENLKLVETVERNGFETRAQFRDLLDKVAVKAVGGPNAGVKSDIVTVGEGC